MSYAAKAYARTSQTTANPREIEAQALLKAETLDAIDAYAAAGVPAHVEEPAAVS